MKSFWTSKKDGADDQGQSDQPDAQNEDLHARTSQEATERTRLLPPDPNQGFLSPEDPAVSGSMKQKVLDCQ